MQQAVCHNVKEHQKAIPHPHSESNQHQNLTTSGGWPLVNAFQVWSTSISAFVNYLVSDGHTHTLGDHNICFAPIQRCAGNNKQCDHWAYTVCSRSSVTLNFDRFTLKLVCESHLRWRTFIPIWAH